MSIVVTENIGSRHLVATREGKQSTYELEMTVRGSMDELAVKNAASIFAPDVVGSGFPQLWKQSVDIRCVGDELWEATAHYDTSGPEPLSAQDSFAFEISGGVQHITQSLGTARYPVDLPDQEGAIGVTEEGVQGADIYAPEMTFEETHFFTELSVSYRALLFYMRGRVNQFGFRGWNAGEVLFEGVSARRQDNRFSTPWSVTYRFRVQANRTVFVAGQEISKFGWQLLDIRYEPTVGDTALVHRAVGAYVHDVYETADFGLIGIGT